MATARKVPQQNYDVLLTLSPGEALVVRTILRNVAGNATATARGLSDGVSRALGEAGVGYMDSLVEGRITCLRDVPPDHEIL